LNCFAPVPIAGQLAVLPVSVADPTSELPVSVGDVTSDVEPVSPDDDPVSPPLDPVSVFVPTSFAATSEPDPESRSPSFPEDEPHATMSRTPAQAPKAESDFMAPS
jgi:hypothetical protein